jgi:hypothetical protein
VLGNWKNNKNNKRMDFFKNKKQKIFIASCSMLAVFVVSYSVYRVLATEDTNINSESKFAWSENGGWLNFGSDDGNVIVNDGDLTGYVWSESLGWISLNCSNDDSCGTVDYKISNDGEGNLSGYAWGENIGWINFSPSDGGVTIDSEGIFSGYAWGENIGWVVFNCSDIDSCGESSFKVKTSWIPGSARDDDNDENDSDGNLEVYDVKYSSTDTTVVIKWKTDHDADEHIRWGENRNLEKEKNNGEKMEKHQVILRQLEPNKEYFFRVKSTDSNERSDSSRIYSVLTKSSSNIFVKRSWKNFESGQEEESKEYYEEVEIEVSDKSEKEIEKEEKILEKESLSKEEPRGENGDPSTISSVFSSIGKTIGSFFSSAGELVASSQRKISKFFARVAEGIGDTYDSLASKFSREKSKQLARLNQAKFFTTQVFNRDELKLLSEVRFQILDKSENPIPNLETTLFSEPQASITDENGIAKFLDVPIGSHTLAFDYQGEEFRKKVAISDTLTEEGNVRMEVVQVKAQREKVAIWMWVIIISLILSVASAVYFAGRYYKLKKISYEKRSA